MRSVRSRQRGKPRRIQPEIAKERVAQAVTCWRRHMSPIKCVVVLEDGIPPEQLEKVKTQAEKVRADVEGKQAADLKRFDACVSETHSILLRLAETGADIPYVLWILIRLEHMKGAELPKPRTLTFEKKDFSASEDEGAFTLTATKRLRAPFVRKRRRGPPETPLSFQMALLARNLRRTTGKPHWKEIAGLIRVWAPWARGERYLRAEHVRRRAQRVRREHPREFFRQARYADGYRKALHYELEETRKSSG